MVPASVDLAAKAVSTPSLRWVVRAPVWRRGAGEKAPGAGRERNPKVERIRVEGPGCRLDGDEWTIVPGLAGVGLEADVTGGIGDGDRVLGLVDRKQPLAQDQQRRPGADQAAFAGLEAVVGQGSCA